MRLLFSLFSIDRDTLCITPLSQCDRSQEGQILRFDLVEGVQLSRYNNLLSSIFKKRKTNVFLKNIKNPYFVSKISKKKEKK